MNERKRAAQRRAIAERMAGRRSGYGPSVRVAWLECGCTVTVPTSRALYDVHNCRRHGEQQVTGFVGGDLLVKRTRRTNPVTGTLFTQQDDTPPF